MKVAEKIKAIFAKAQDEALKVATEDSANTETPEEKKGFVSYDDFKKFGDAVMSKLDGMSKPGKDVASTEEVSEVKAKDDEAPEAGGMEGRLAKLEAAVAKLLARETKEDEVPVGDADKDGDDSEESDDAASCDEDGDDEVTDDEPEMVGDSAGNDEEDLAARVEILAPGMKSEGKDAKKRALVRAYATKDGKAVIEQFTRGKAPNWKDEKALDALFVGASELLKVRRTEELSQTKTTDFQANLGQPKGAMTPEKLNELNAKHYGGNRTTH